MLNFFWATLQVTSLVEAVINEISYEQGHAC